ncbi:hypothetical protein SAMN05421780_105199 [Flexibacter flexilis DSM 6793]|uniref:Uncharacterized protein n=1 Tax=Flexibacter flexilis DSM 6793 TaxID=927664 RepID=A0A1I1J5L7_9BACT|nr:DUF6691 family protein [Flexibacter flexilis]SFC43292.1 hypothetical protein SAMN05421780_105199 [Flexibacter flexilis DSM 6793]
MSETQKTKSSSIWLGQLRYVVVGMLFGIVFIKAEIASWYRIQEMFRFQSFHMYGVIGSAVAVAMLSLWLIRKFDIRSMSGEKITVAPKEWSIGQVYGGLFFGCGWAITGACPGPLYAQIGAGSVATIVTLLSAILGTWTYGYFRDRLPH